MVGHGGSAPVRVTVLDVGTPLTRDNESMVFKEAADFTGFENRGF
jgi:hypothetical protein